jgi:hypothetical protein
VTKRALLKKKGKEDETAQGPVCVIWSRGLLLVVEGVSGRCDWDKNVLDKMVGKSPAKTQIPDGVGYPANDK